MAADAPWPPADLDHHSEVFARRHEDFYRRARSECPVLRSNAHGGFAIVTRYGDIRAALRDHEAFSSARFLDTAGRLQGGAAIPPNGVRIGIVEMDPPEGTRLRGVLRPWFSLAAVEAGAARIGEIVRWVVDGVIERGACDVVSDLAKPLPSIIILDILGLPLDRWRAYGKILHEAVAKEGGSLAGLRWLMADLRETIERGDYAEGGLVDALLRAESVDRAMACELTLMLLFGGTDTTIAAISHSMRHLSAHPEDRLRLIARPEDIPAAVDEFLRLYSPSTGVARTLMRDTEIAGTPLRKGDRILCAVNSANRDEAVFTDAEHFDLDRPARPHLAFGAGTHACLGQNLARADLRMFLSEALRRMPDFEVDLDACEPYRRTPLVQGYSAMPMRFTPSAGAGGARDDVPTLLAPRFAPAP